MKILLKGNLIYLVVIAICILLVVNIVFTKINNDTIEQNKQLQSEAQTIKIYYDQIGKIIIHGADLGVRAYAIYPKESLAEPLYNSRSWFDSIFNNVEVPLAKQGFDLKKLHHLKDSISTYVALCFEMKKLIDEGKPEEFRQLFLQDSGREVWAQYISTEVDIHHFISEVNREAEVKYEAALQRNQILQILLFLICVPTLLFTAFYTQKTFVLSEKLRTAEEEKNKNLEEQKATLEKTVAERTSEIINQNKEIFEQREELAAKGDILSIQNRQLQEAHKIIQSQVEEITWKNEQLERDVLDRTIDLQNANKQLIDHNNQLEQFSFITAHNLRAPLARILGIANVMDITTDTGEKENLMNLLVRSTRDLDQVIKDLNTILDIKKHTGNLTTVELPPVYERVIKILEKEIQETGTIVRANFQTALKVEAVAPYVESMLYNLISNAIKYRNPEKQPIILISTTMEDDYICLSVQDNGLGIDLKKHGSNLFTLYKRFHLHMEGKGLGLYLVKTQIYALGGKIDVTSKPFEGTTFYLYFKR